jgi:hypothetical protein
MTPKDHINRIVAWFSVFMGQKYMVGQDEHGGKLWRKPVINAMKDEVIDMVVYFEVLEAQYTKAVAELEVAMEVIREFNKEDFTDRTDEWIEATENAYNILVFGNKEGELEEDH